MKKNIKTKTHNLYKIIFLFVVFLGIGYAFLEATLNINGDVIVEAPELNVYVQSTSITSGSTTGTPTIIGNDKKEVDFTTALTSDGSSFFEETTTIINKGTASPYLLSVDVKVYDSSNNEVTLSAPYEYSVTKGDGTAVVIGEQIGVGNTKSFKFKFNYVTGTDMSTVTTYPSYTFKITYNYVINPIILPSGKTKDNLEVGDELCILDQCFNFLHYDGTNNEDIVMLAKYNLNVGTNAKAPETGLQDSDVRGYKTGFTTYGTVGFSYVDYWTENNMVKSKYGNDWYDNDIYDTNYNFGPNTVLHYVENYKTKLTDDYHVTIKKIRLLTYNETTDTGIGCTQSSCPADSFIANTSFWYGSVKEANTVLALYGTNVGTWNRTTDGYLGVRPVVVIAKENI